MNAKNFASLLFILTLLASCQDTKFNDVEIQEEALTVNTSNTNNGNATTGDSENGNSENNTETGNTGGSTGTDDTGSSDLSDEQLIEACQQKMNSNSLITKTVTVHFPQTIECNFNESGSGVFDLNSDGNGPRINLFVTARVEQDFNVSLPQNAKICDMDFSFSEQQMKYDDEIILTLNNKVLFMSKDYSTNSPYQQYQESGFRVDENGHVHYSWKDSEYSLLGLDYVTNIRGYCFGVNPYSSDFSQRCHIPKTDTLGTINMDIPMQDMVLLGRSFNSGISSSELPLNFQFITTGDNDNGDCEHSDLSFDVEIKYFQD